MTARRRAGVAAQHPGLARLPAPRAGWPTRSACRSTSTTTPRRWPSARGGAGAAAGRARLHRHGRVDRRRRRDRARRPAARRRRAATPATSATSSSSPTAARARAAPRAASRPRRRHGHRRPHRAAAGGGAASRSARAPAGWSAGRWRRWPTCSTSASRWSPARSPSASATTFFAAAQAELDRAGPASSFAAGRTHPPGRPRRRGPARRRGGGGVAGASATRSSARSADRGGTTLRADGSHLPARGRRVPGEGAGVPRRAPARRTGRASARSTARRPRRSPTQWRAHARTSTATSRRRGPRSTAAPGLTALEQVILAEEFATGRRAHRRHQRRVLASRWSATRCSHWGTEEQKRHFIPRILSRRGHLVPGLLRAQRRVRPRQPRLPGHARRRRVGDQRPEDLDVGRPPRQLDLRAHPHRPRRRRSTRASRSCSARWTSPASRCGRSR